MRLYFVRHAEALDGMDDDIRPLSNRGRMEAKRVADFLEATGIRFDAAYSSPLIRANQTAQVLLEQCRANRDVELNADPALRNETPQNVFNRWLLGLAPGEHLLFVGHAPTLAARVRHLLQMEHAEAFSFPTAGLACLDTQDRRHARLMFYIAPWMLSSRSE